MRTLSDSAPHEIPESTIESGNDGPTSEKTIGQGALTEIYVVLQLPCPG
jgi:hypothetical protein